MTEAKEFGILFEGTPDAVAALELDASRYRWLRAQYWDSGPVCVVADPRNAVKLGYYCPSMGGLDDLIDDAMRIRLDK